MADKTQEYINYIQQRVSRAELLAQLADEGAELTQAALKMHRTMMEGNPTPVTEEEAEEHLLEEITVSLIASGLCGFFSPEKVMGLSKLYEDVAERWAKQLGYEEPKRGDHNDMCVRHSADCLCNTCVRDGMCDRCSKTPRVVGGCRITRCDKYIQEEA